MTTKTLERTKENLEIKKIETKAAILDDLLEFIEDRYFGYLMSLTETENNIPLAKAKTML